MLKIGAGLGFNPILVTVLGIYSDTNQLFFYMVTPVITVLAFNLFRLKDWYKLVLIGTVLNFLMVPVYILTYWHLIGLV